jgi:hypothetical protein
MHFPKWVLILAMSFGWFLSQAQKVSYSTECDLVHDFLQAATQEFDFASRANKRPITLLDRDTVLVNCKSDSIGSIRFIVLDSGVEVDKLRQNDLLGAPTKRKDLFYVFRKIEGKRMGWAVVDPYTNGCFSWTFIKHNKQYIFQKKGGGWF